MKYNRSVYKSLVMISQLGISMLAPVILCAFVGNWLDERFGWSSTAVLLILGILAGARNTWILIKQVQQPDTKRRQHEEQKNK